jgi:hypothetical protein
MPKTSYKIPQTKIVSNTLSFPNISLKGLKLGYDSRQHEEHILEMRDHSMLLVGTKIDKQVDIITETATYIDTSDASESTTDQYPQITSVGRTDLIGGASISTHYNDLNIGLYDKGSFQNSRVNKEADQNGSAIIRSKGLEPTHTDNLHKKTGLEVYHGMRITDFGDNNAFNSGENKYNADTLSTHESSSFNNDTLDNIYELSYVRDSNGNKYQKTLAHHIHMHSDTKTSITRHVHQIIKMDSEGLLIKNKDSQIKLNEHDIEVKGDQFYVEEELCIGSKSSVNYRLKIDGEKLIVTKFDGETNKGQATVIDVVETYNPIPTDYLIGIHHGTEGTHDPHVHIPMPTPTPFYP